MIDPTSDDRKFADKQLKRELSGLELFTLAFGAIIGVSWIVLVGDWIDINGSFGAIIAFCIGGILILPVGYCYAELGRQFPTTGGEIIYAYKFLGVFPAFFTGWILSLLYISVCAFEVVSVAWVAQTIFPALGGPVLYVIYGETLTLGDILIGVVMAFILGWTQARGVSIAARLQDGMTFCLLVLTLTFIIAAIAGGDSENLKPLIVQNSSGGGFAFWSLVLITPLFFAGFGTIPQALGEATDNARRRLPWIITSVILASVAFYALVIFAVGYVLPIEQLRGADLPAAAAVDIALGMKWLSLAVLTAGFFGLITTWNAVLFAGSRSLFALGRGRLIPSLFAVTGDKSLAPVNAIRFITILSVAAAPFGTSLLTPIVSVGGLCVTTMFCVTATSALKLKIDQSKGRRLHFFELLTPGVALVISVLLTVLALIDIVQSAASGSLGRLVVMMVWCGFGLILWWAQTRERREFPAEERNKVFLEKEHGTD